MQRFVIIGHRRTGTTLLGHTLGSHQDILFRGEILNADFVGQEAFWGEHIKADIQAVFGRQFLLESDDPVPYIEQILSGCGGIKAVGFKMLYDQAQDGNLLKAWEYIQHRSDILLFHVSRKNLLQMVLSDCLARQNQVWEVEIWNIPPIHHPVVLDYKDLYKEFTRIEDEMRRYNKFVAMKPCYSVIYEQLTEHFTSVIRGAQEFLDVPYRHLRPSHHKQVRDHPSVLIINYKELHKMFSGSKWEAFFNDKLSPEVKD